MWLPIEYAATAWDLHISKQKHSLEMVPRRAARWVTNRYHNTSSVSDMLHTLGWRSLEHRRATSRLCIHGSIGIPHDPYIYGAPFSHVFTELKIFPIEVHISAIQLDISPIQLKISLNQLEISTNIPIWRYLQFIWRYLQFIWRYLQIRHIWRYLQFNCRYLQFDKSDKISAPRRKNRCAMIQVNGLIKSCI